MTATRSGRMIGRWAKAAALLVLMSAVVVDLGLATALLQHAPRDLPLVGQKVAEWVRQVMIPEPRLALAGRAALLGGAIAGMAAAGAGLLLGAAAAELAAGPRAVLVFLARLPALTALLLGGLATLLLLPGSGPAAAVLAGFSVATRPLGAAGTLAVVLLPVAMGIVERAGRRLDHRGFQSLATAGIGPARRLLTLSLPSLLGAALRAATVSFCAATLCLFIRAWPVQARQEAVSLLAATLASAGPSPGPLAAAAFCGAVAVALVAALLWPRPA